MAGRYIWLLFFASLHVKVNCYVDQLVRHCNEDWCSKLDPLDHRYSSTEYHKQLIQFFSAGIPQLIYQDSSTTAAKADISDSCRGALVQVSKALFAGEEWAFRRKYFSTTITTALI